MLGVLLAGVSPPQLSEEVGDQSCHPDDFGTVDRTEAAEANELGRGCRWMPRMLKGVRSVPTARRGVSGSDVSIGRHGPLILLRGE